MLISMYNENMILNGNTLIEVLPLYDLFAEYQDHKRLTVFVHKGRECVICGREGVLLLVTQQKGGRKHVDLYTEDFVLMTVDHIVPKKQGRLLGWSKAEIEALSNKQPMCSPCNNKKDSLLVTNEEYALKRLRNGYPHKRKGQEAIWDLVNCEGIFKKTLAL